MNIKHNVVWHLLRPPVAIFLKLRFGFTSCRAKTCELPDNYLVLSNHTTDYDPLMVATSFRRQMYFVASEHITRWKHAYPIIKFLVEPIIRKKGMSAAHAIIDILRKLKHGENVCMFAEGVRTWDGVTCPISATTGQLVKKAGCGLVTYKLIGGYFLSPGWSNVPRRGMSHGDIVNIYSKEQLALMSVDEINAVIVRDLHEDAYARQLAEPKRYRGKRLAEKIENLLFICPECSARETITSSACTAVCSSCGMTLTFDEYGMLSGTHCKTVLELSRWQNGEVENDVSRGAVYEMRDAVLWLIDDKANVAARGSASLGAGGFSMGDVHIPLSDIDNMAFHGRRKVVFSSKKNYYELCPADGVNAVKFVKLYEAMKNVHTTQEK